MSRRRPTLRVISHSLTTPRRVVPFVSGEPPREVFHVVEVWSEAEWSLLTPAERPRGAGVVPGVGRVCLREVNKNELTDAQEVYDAALDAVGWAERK